MKGRSYPQPKSDVVRQEIQRVRGLARRLTKIADALEEVDEGGSWSGTGGSVTQMHRANGSDNNPTLDAVQNGAKSSLRSRAFEIAKVIRRKLPPVIKDIEYEVSSAYKLSVDHDLRGEVEAAEAISRRYDRPSGRSA